jgi:hypothetical protein
MFRTRLLSLVARVQAHVYPLPARVQAHVYPLPARVQAHVYPLPARVQAHIYPLPIYKIMQTCTDTFCTNSFLSIERFHLNFVGSIRIAHAFWPVRHMIKQCTRDT